MPGDEQLVCFWVGRHADGATVITLHEHGLADVRNLYALAADLHRRTTSFDEPMRIVAHDRAALVALRFALDHRERVLDLLLFDAPSPQWRLVEWHPSHRNEAPAVDDLPSIPDRELAQLKVPVVCVYDEAAGFLSGGDRFARVIPTARLAVRRTRRRPPIPERGPRLEFADAVGDGAR
jgi:pimeloyl-ACP methyl ester carboxylesterase